MEYAFGFLVWLGIAIAAAFIFGARYRRTPGTAGWIAFVLALFGTFIGGMLGVSGYVYNDATPLRLGGLIGAVVGGVLITSVYYWVARRLV